MEEVEQLIRKHETFQKVLAAQEEKVMDSGSQRWDGGSLGIWRVLGGGCGGLGVHPQ